MSIADFRKRKGWNQSDLAKRLDVLRSSVAQWESGTTYPKFESIGKMFELGATVEELFGVDCSASCPKSAKTAIVEDKPLTRTEVQRMISEAVSGMQQNPAKAG